MEELFPYISTAYIFCIIWIWSQLFVCLFLLMIIQLNFSFTAYNVVTRTNSNYFKKKELKVTRRFSDFLGLHDKLAEKYRQNGRIIPPAPDKSVVGMTKVKISKDGDEHQDEVSSSPPKSGLKNQGWKIRVEKFASLLSDGFTVMAVINPSEKKLCKSRLCVL